MKFKKLLKILREERFCTMEVCEEAKEVKVASEVIGEVRKLIHNLKNVRKEIGITQQELSKKTGLSQQHISLFERGETGVRLDVLIKYMYGLGIDINNVFRVMSEIEFNGNL